MALRVQGDVPFRILWSIFGKFGLLGAASTAQDWARREEGTQQACAKARDVLSPGLWTAVVQVFGRSAVFFAQVRPRYCQQVVRLLQAPGVRAGEGVYSEMQW